MKRFAGILRIESLFILAGALLAYERPGYGWGFFAVVFFVPDLSMLGYLAGKRVGAIAYNVFHSYASAFVLLIGFFLFPEHLVLRELALIWIAHIAFDRALGFGLKSVEGFKATHLGIIGEKKAEA